MSFTQTVNPVEVALHEARAALQRGDLAAVVPAAQKAVALDPKAVLGWWLWGLAAMEMMNMAEAEQVLNEGLKYLADGHPLRVRFLVQRARALVKRGCYAEANADIDLAIKAVPDDAESLYILGQMLVDAIREPDALPLLERATALNPSAPDYWHSRGNAEHFMGKLDDAERSYETSLALRSDTAVHLALARLKKWTPEHNHIPRLLDVAADMPIDIGRKGYALFKEYDDVGDRDAAWTALQTGALAMHQTQTASGPSAWSPAIEAATVDAWKVHFPVGRFANPPSLTRTGPRRIFIVGLPRSGTTLVERILTAHSQVKAQGELQTFGLATKVLTGSLRWNQFDPETVAKAAALDPQAIAEYYDRETSYLNDGAAYVIDKLPHNYEVAGLIQLAFPDAIIVHVRREPMDALFGAYKLFFAAQWSFDQDDLADHYMQYLRLMMHWQACLGSRLINVSLEAVIANPEAEIRRLIAACGLSWEEACLNPHEAEGAVATASSVQVRKPINSEGVNAWRKYEAGMQPLRARLVRVGLIDGDGRATTTFG